jgi:ABC-type sugar transport system substrate-binding protein
MVFAGGGKSGGKSGETKIGVSIMELTAYTWYLGVIDGCKNWAAEHPEAGFTFQFEDSKSDVQTMLNNIDNLITAGAKGIILFPADASSAIPVMKQYTKEGIPFVIGDYEQQPSSPSDVVWSTYVGHNMKALGQIAGKVAVDYLKTLKTDTPVCLFISRPASGQVSVDRFEGYKEVILASFPKARIINEGDNDNNRASAQALMENILQREKHIDVVSGHNDTAVMGAYNGAVSQKRNEIKFVGIAGDKDVLNFITNGNPAWIGEVLQDPTTLGYVATDAMYKTLQGQKLSPKADLPAPEAITPANIKTYKWQSWSWL